jgi:hypothetical protein
MTVLCVPGSSDDRNHDEFNVGTVYPGHELAVFTWDLITESMRFVLEL